MTSPTLDLALSFDPKEHEYWAATKRLPGITEIMRISGYASDYKFLDRKYRDRGHGVHEACQAIDQDDYDEARTGEAIRPFAAGWSKFVKEFGFSGVMWEMPFASVEQGYAGTPDVGGWLPNERIALVEVKSGAIPKTVMFQLAGQRQLILKGQPINEPTKAEAEWIAAARRAKTLEIFCVNLPGDGDYKLRSFPEPRWDLAWRTCLNHYHLSREFGI